jgi:hypothetical protein
MKWGQKNGPPYPIRDGGHSAAEVRANPSLAKGASNTDGTQKARTKEEAKFEAKRNPRKYDFDELKKNVERMRLEEEYRRINGQLTKQQMAELKSIFARNVLGLTTKELPSAVIDVGKEYWKVSKMFWEKILLSTAPDIMKNINASVKAAQDNAKGKKSKSDNKNDDLNEPVVNDMEYRHRRYEPKYVPKHSKKR